MTHLDNFKPDSEKRNRRRERKLWQNEGAGTPSLGCIVCTEFKTCGGLVARAKSFDCMRHCCGGKPTCDIVCPRSPKKFCRSLREIDTFDLTNIQPANSIAHPKLPKIVPWIMHGKSHSALLDFEVVAIPFPKLFEKREGRTNFKSPEELRQHFKLSENTRIIVSGVAEDPPLEAWWGLGRRKRRELLKTFKANGIQFMTSPNFSLFTNRPRHDDLHAMKRIGISWKESFDAELPCALHVNGRTPRDFERWAEFVVRHPEIEYLSYEFGTGAGHPDRCLQHAAWVKSIATETGRSLGLVFRGHGELLSSFAQAFKNVVYIDTTSFMKSVNRQRLTPLGNDRFEWRPSPTEQWEPIDELFEANTSAYGAWLLERANQSTKNES